MAEPPRRPIPIKKDIKLFGYNVKIETEETKLDKPDDSDIKTLCIRIYYDSDESHVKSRKFFDEFYISHKSMTFLHQVVHTIHACFSKEAIANGFIHHNEELGTFQFQFEVDDNSNTRILSVIRTCCLSKAKYTKQAAIDKVMQVNAPLIKQWKQTPDNTNKLSVDCINAHVIHDPQWELEVTLNLKPGLYHFHVPDLLSVPTSISVRDYIRIRDYYMNKLKDFYKDLLIFRVYLDHIATQNRWMWTSLGLEAGPMSNLVTVLAQIENDCDSIWSKLFELCVIDVYETDNGKDIAISDVHTSTADLITEQSVANFIALSIKYYCLDRKTQEERALLTPCDKYLLSIVLPYFDIKGVHSHTHTPSANSGLFNRYVKFYEDKKMSDWKMKIDAATLKKELLIHLQPISVIKNSFRYTKREGDECEYDLTEVVCAAETGEDNVLICYDNTYSYEWVIWHRKTLKQLMPASKGRWSLVSEFGSYQKVPIKHLDAMRKLCEGTARVDGGEMRIHLYDTDAHKTAEYVIKHCATSAASSASLCLRIVLCADPAVNRMKKIHNRDFYFLNFLKGVTEWQWYNNDSACYNVYTLGDAVTLQMEATYQGVQECNFPLCDYYRESSDNRKERLFLLAQLSELSRAMVDVLGLAEKPFVMRISFAPDGCTVNNMEQLAINSRISTFPRNMRRVVVRDVVEDDELHCLGRMWIHYDDDDMIRMDWETQNHHFVAQCDAHEKCLVKEALETWRANKLFPLNPAIKWCKETTIERNYPYAKREYDDDDVAPPCARHKIDDVMWNALDALDDGGKCDDGDTVSVWREYHSKDAFRRRRLFTLLGLQRIQSIISVMAQDSKELIIAISNELMTDNESTAFNRSLSYLFNGESNMKRIDSTHTIYDVSLTIAPVDLHSFVCQHSSQTQTLFVFRRRGSHNIYVAHDGLCRKLFLHRDRDLHYFLPTFVGFAIGDLVSIECFCYPDWGTVTDYYYHNDMIYYRIRSSHNVFYTLHYYAITGRPQQLKARPSLSLGDMRRGGGALPDPSHPMHTLSLSLIESSAQAISAMRDIPDIRDKLFECGVVYLVYRVVLNEEESEDVRRLLAHKDMTYIDPVVLREYRSGSERNGLTLEQLTAELSAKKVLFNRTNIGQEMSYSRLNQYHDAIFEENNNKLYVIRITERRKLVVVCDEKEEEGNLIAAAEAESSGSDTDNWATYEMDGEQLEEIESDEQQQHIEISSTFSSVIECSYEMSAIHRRTQSIRDLMCKYRNTDCEFSVDENRLLTFFAHNFVYNLYDLCDENIVSTLKRQLHAQTMEPRFWKLYKKFEEFIKRVAADDAAHVFSLYKNVICGVESTLCALLLRRECGGDDDSTMVITYNPLQSVVITPSSAKDITHPIHIYRSAYEGDSFIPLNTLYTSWMTRPTQPPLVARVYAKNENEVPATNIIDCLTRLISWNKKFEMIVVPSSVHLAESWLREQCREIALYHDAIAHYRTSFTYRGNVYALQTLSGGGKEDELLLNDLKYLMKHIASNIVENACPIRSSICRNNGDIMLRFFKVGCGSCFLHEASGINYEIGPPPSANYERDFPAILRKAMFVYYIDCKIPVIYNNNYVECGLCKEYMLKPARIKKCKLHRFCYKCLLQWQQMADNPEIGCNPLLHQDESKNKISVTTDATVLNEIILPKYCPNYAECHTQLTSKDDIVLCKEIDESKSLPITVYQQLRDANDSRYTRLDLMNRYQQHREMKLIQDQPNYSKLTLQELQQQYPKMANILAGYDAK